MINRKDLMFLRHNEEKQLVGFSYEVIDKDSSPTNPEYHCFVADWTKCDGEGVWNMRVVLPRDRDADSNVYNFCYQMPRDGLPVELIAATGLKYYQLYLKEEIQRKSNFDFVLGELLRDM